MAKINLIQNDIRNEEMVDQVVCTVERLSLVMENMFNSVDGRLDALKGRMTSIQDRSIEAQRNIDKIRESKSKVTKVFARHRYPAKSVNQPYQALDNIPWTSIRPDESNMKSYSKEPINGAHIPFDDESLKDKIKFFITAREKRPAGSGSLDSKNGVDSVPWERITNVGTLVMFNSSENPFLRSRQVSSLVDVKMKIRKGVQSMIDDTDGIVPLTPSSILNSEQIESQEKMLQYNPNSQAAPKILDSLPSALPHLPGIADDLLFTSEETFDHFNRSSSEIGSLPKLISSPIAKPEAAHDFQAQRQVAPTNIQSLSQSTPPPPMSSGQQTLPSANTPMVPSIPPPPPPPPPPPLVTLPSGPAGPPPPPPPPPPSAPIAPPPPPAPLVPPSSTDDSQPTVPTPAAPKAPIGDPREGLLASIRQAGGRPTKKPINLKQRKIEEKKEARAVVSDDFMSALQQKLNDRRKGISGKSSEVDGPKSGSSLSRAAAAIMSQQRRDSVSSSASSINDDADWDDN